MTDIGAQTPFFYIFREIELTYDLFEAATDTRMMHNHFRIGGVAVDLHYGGTDKYFDFCNYKVYKVSGIHTEVSCHSRQRPEFSNFCIKFSPDNLKISNNNERANLECRFRLDCLMKVMVGLDCFNKQINQYHMPLITMHCL